MLDLLRFAIPMLYPPGLNVAVGFEGEIFQAYRTTPTLSDKTFTIYMVNVGPHSDLELSAANLKAMRGFGVLEVSEVLRKPSQGLNDFEEALLRSIHWFADAETQPEPENQLLSLITCLETFLTPRDRSPIRTAVAEGVAIVLTEGLRSRKALKKFITGVYEQRSAVSHGGRRAVLQVDLDRLKLIAHALIQELIRRKDEFTSRKALADWL